MAESGMVKCEVCIIGLGVSSLPLVKELEKSGTDYRVVSSDAFGVWQKLDAAGENFDLVTTIESTNYSWWSYDYDFPFYTAKEYYAKLKAELTESIMAKVIFKAVGHIQQEATGYRVVDSAGTLLVSCSKLVHSIGFSPDQNLFSNLKVVAAAAGGGKHFLVSGLSDTTNLYISRLICAGNRVTVTCQHFHVLDKIGTTHDNVGGPFDQYEPFQHWADQTAPNITGILVPLPIRGAKVGSPNWLMGKVQSYVSDRVGLKEVVDLRKFDTEVQYCAQGLVDPAKTEVPGGLGLLVKQWPVDEYAKYYNDPSFQEWMLKSGVYLNDIYFFMQQGLVKVHKRDEVQHLAGKRYLVAGEEVEFDEVLGCCEAKHKLLEVRGCRPFTYSEHLYGIWNRIHPNLFFLGTTRPYTGAFGCVSELSSLFVHRMLTNSSFQDFISKQFPSLMHRQRVTHHASVSDPDKLHVQWAGMHCLRIAKTLGCDLSYREAGRLGLRVEQQTGPINALRCRITGPYALPGAAARYKRSCKKINTSFMSLNMIYRNWGDRMVVVSWFVALCCSAGFAWLKMSEVEKLAFYAVFLYLLTKATLLSQWRGVVLMLAFDNLYHKRAWIMLLSNVCQLVFNCICFLHGTTYDVPLLVRLGLPVDVIFLVLGRISYPRAFFGDMRVRKPYAKWLFNTYLPRSAKFTSGGP
ncbi:unnamed protein product [Polarella glacialis]|uniref:Flavin-containing monooxygenase n=1 Tax=Polarella glacialis TaxID=89957 RepID=A0A813L5C2_POLGL|nr:unnamed protein product [Polarella glacialis]